MGLLIKQKNKPMESQYHNKQKMRCGAKLNRLPHRGSKTATMPRYCRSYLASPGEISSELGKILIRALVQKGLMNQRLARREVRVSI
jgi:hypothetical protein